MSGERKVGTAIKQLFFKFQRLLIWKYSCGPDGLLMCDKDSNLSHVQMCGPVASQPHLYSQKEILGLE